MPDGLSGRGDEVADTTATPRVSGMSAVIDDVNGVEQLASGGLRPMTELDLKVVMGIELSAYPHPWTRGIFRDCLHVGYCCWVYEEAGKVLAYGVMSIGAGEAHILNLCVWPQARRRGLGRMLLAHLLDVARAHKADTSLLEVRPSNRPALQLYHDMGYNEVGTRKAYYPAENGHEDALIMARAL